MSIIKDNYKRVISPLEEFRIEIRFSANGRLSMSGHYSGSCGQIRECLLTALHEGAERCMGFTDADISTIYKYWTEWHLNDLRAGTPRQIESLRRVFGNERMLCIDYDKAVSTLKDMGIYEDNGHRYGTAWLFEEVPENVVKYLFSLPSVSGDSWEDMRPISIDIRDLEAILEG